MLICYVQSEQGMRAVSEPLTMFILGAALSVLEHLPAKHSRTDS